MKEKKDTTKLNDGNAFEVFKAKEIVIGMFILVMIPLVSTLLVSVSSPFSIIIDTNNEEVWLLFFASLFSGIFGSYIGAYVVSRTVKLQLDRTKKDQDDLHNKRLKTDITMNSYKEYKIAFQTMFEIGSNMYKYYYDIYESSQISSISYNETTYQLYDKKIEELVTELIKIFNVNSLIMSELDNKGKLLGDVDSKQLKQAVEDLNDHWNSCNDLMKSYIVNGNVTEDEIWDNVENELIDKIHATAINFTLYEKSFVEYFLDDIFKSYTVKPIKLQRYSARYEA
jgi:hypothetical protein